tara:strand:+ start:180 stop:749 length:570 start_codon:yes stop_codon:yes gene_type:complete
MNYPDIIFIEPRALNDEGCEKIIDIWDSIEYQELLSPEHGEGDWQIEVEDDTVSYRYHHSGKDMATLREPHVDQVLDIMGEMIPNHPDFGPIHYMQIVRYNEGSFFPFHTDAADSTDTATTMLLLNDNYHGGELMIEPGVRVTPQKGSVISFNNSTKILHGVEPIYKGERFVLLIWYGSKEETNEQTQV